MEIDHNQGTLNAPQRALQKAWDFTCNPVSGLMSSPTTTQARGETVTQSWEYDRG